MPLNIAGNQVVVNGNPKRFWLQIAGKNAGKPSSDNELG
jgi:hypothetical protein